MYPDTSGESMSTQLNICPDTAVPTGKGTAWSIGEKILLTTEDLSFLLGLAVVTIKNSRNTGLLLGRTPPPHIKAGRLVRYRRDDVVRWINALPAHHHKGI